MKLRVFIELLKFHSKFFWMHSIPVKIPSCINYHQDINRFHMFPKISQMSAFVLFRTIWLYVIWCSMKIVICLVSRMVQMERASKVGFCQFCMSDISQSKHSLRHCFLQIIDSHFYRKYQTLRPNSCESWEIQVQRGHR